MAMVNVLALGWVYVGTAPTILALAGPVLISLLCAWRMFQWWRVRNHHVTPARAVRMLNHAIGAAILLSITVTTWSLALLPFGDTYQQSHVLFFLAATIMVGVFCQMYVRVSPLVVMIFILGPMTVVFATSPILVFQILAFNIVIITVAVIAIMRMQYDTFADLVESRRSLREQARAAEQLSSELHRNQTELKLILDNIPTRILYKDDKNRIIRLNRAAAQEMGMTIEEAEGADTYSLFSDQHFSQLAKKYHDDDLDVINSGKPKLGIVEEYRPGTGESTWVRTDKVPYTDPETGERFVFVAATDITSEKLAQEELISSEQRYRSLYRNAPVMMLSIGPGRKLVNISDYWLEQFGYERDDVIGRPIAEFLGESGVPESVAKAIPAFYRSGYIKDVEFQLFKKSGEVIDVLATAAAEYSENGRIIGGMVVLVDITDRKIVERQFLQAQKMEMVGQLTGGLAHDFNNLLGVVIGNLELVDRDLEPDDTARQRLTAAANAADKGAELTRRLLAFSRRQALETEVLDLNPLIGNLGDMLHRTLGEAIVLECQLGENIPQVKTDQTQFESALLNLAVNARDAMPQGGKLTIESSVATIDEEMASREDDVLPGEYVVVAVSDTGSGIPEEALSKVFEPFFTTKEVGKGSGLGLSMIHGIMNQMGGYVRIYSEVGHGTTVRLYLPVDKSSRSVNRTESIAVEDEIGGWETILVTEDQPEVREVAVGLLEYLGYKVVEAENGEQAIAQLESNSEIDLLFTDIVMPGDMDGKNLADAARVLRPDLPIVFTTGYAEAAVLRSGEIKAAHNLVTKPYRKADLAVKIRDALDRKKAAAPVVAAAA
jgi:PAS domain S-box-containing protein